MDDLTSEVTDESTDDLTKFNDLRKAQHTSDVIVNCCRMNSARNFMNEIAFIVALKSGSDRSDTRYSDPDITGSCAELYIDPGEKCVGDIDLMFPWKKCIVVCDGSVVDSIDVDETIEVHHIETSDCPNGYVHLRSFGKLQFNWETEQFEYRVSDTTGTYLRIFGSHYDTDIVIHGPAQIVESCFSKLTTVDLVPCIRLLAWPSVAQSWIQRDKNHSWPSNAVVFGMVAI